VVIDHTRFREDLRDAEEEGGMRPKPAELAECLQDVAREWPLAVLRRNAVGNLLIYATPEELDPVGYVELMECEWRRFADEFGET
jgi:hypothetical protein